MWTPPERIRHAPLEDVAPTAEEAARSRLFSPITLASGLALRERPWVPAMVPWRATEDGFVTQEVLDWYGRLADGEPGAIVVEATGIRDVPSGPLLRAGHDRFVEGLAKLTETVRRRSGSWRPGCGGSRSTPRCCDTASRSCHRGASGEDGNDDNRTRAAGEKEAREKDDPAAGDRQILSLIHISEPTRPY